MKKSTISFQDPDGTITADLEAFLADQRQKMPGVPLSLSYVVRIAIKEGLSSLRAQK